MPLKKLIGAQRRDLYDPLRAQIGVTTSPFPIRCATAHQPSMWTACMKNEWARFDGHCMVDSAGETSAFEAQ